MKNRGLGKVQLSLPNQMAVLVPSTTQGDKKISSAEFRKRIKETQTKLSSTFGGQTSIQTRGGYFSNDLKKLINEDVVMVVSYSKNNDYKKEIGKLKEWLNAKKRDWKQESIGVIVENDLFYV